MSRTDLVNPSQRIASKLDRSVDSAAYISNMISEMDGARKHMEQLRHEQERKFGMTLDAADMLKSKVEKTKAANVKLLTEIESGKQVYSRLKEESAILQSMFERCQEQIQELKKQEKTYNLEKRAFSQLEVRSRKLNKTNRNMRTLLAKHHIDPRAELGRRTPDRTPINRQLTSKSAEHLMGYKKAVQQSHQRLIPSKIIWQ